MSWFDPDKMGMDAPDASGSPDTEGTQAPPASTPPAQDVTTPAPAPAPAVSSPVKESTPSPSVKDDTLPEHTYRKRRVFAVAFTALAVLAGGYLVIPRDGQTPSLSLPGSTQEAEILASEITPIELARMDQRLAIKSLKKGKSLRSFTPQPGGQVNWAYVKDTAVFGRAMDGQCLIYAIVDGKPTDVQVDETGYGCTEAAIKAANTELKQLAN